MANVAKYTTVAVGHMFNHYERRSGENVQRGNEQIDPTKTALNYDLHTGDTADGQRTAPTATERLQKRLSEVKHLDLSKRSDINVMCDWVVTLPSDVSSDKAGEFFKHSYDFMCDRYGKKNVISAWVHMDETTPHMHFSFVPVVEKDGVERLCAKERVSRLDLTHFHSDLQRYVEDKMQQDVAVLNGATAGGNLTIIELKMRKALTELAEVQATSSSLESLKPFIENSQKMLTEVGEAFRELDTALKAKKWFGDDDKAKMKAVGERLDFMKAKVESIGKTATQLDTALQGVTGSVRNSLDEAFKQTKQLEAQAQRRIKREENKIRRWSEKLTEKEQNLDREIDKGVRQKLARYEKPIKDKLAQSKALDEEIARKQKQLNAVNSEVWFMQNRQLSKKLQKWRDERDESKSIEPTHQR